MVFDVGPGPGDRIMAVQPAERLRDSLQTLGLLREPAGGRHADQQEVPQRALLEDQAALHVGLPNPEAGIGEDARRVGRIGQPDGHEGRIAGAGHVAFAPRVDQRQGAVADGSSEQAHEKVEGRAFRDKGIERLSEHGDRLVPV
ncbi:hypothetical protein [Phenylobacterium sp. CCH12-B4]|uniref:hypothetical protein n=1 Tax=Phenylobacterium sp. CCH12-B4 TaxID=1768784 RepID=UPI000839F6CC|nr:hypothetical protein [Phenylobacterium sp. CCH12-B4]